VTLSQSGETADTLAALRYARESGYLATLSICNVPGSSLVRESDLHLLTRAGPEIGVASTKAFTTQLLSMLLLTLLLARRRAPDSQGERRRLEQLRRLSGQVEEVLNLNRRIEALRPTWWSTTMPCSSAAARSAPSHARARSSSRRSPTSTPKPTPQAS